VQLRPEGKAGIIPAAQLQPSIEAFLRKKFVCFLSVCDWFNVVKTGASKLELGYVCAYTPQNEAKTGVEGRSERRRELGTSLKRSQELGLLLSVLSLWE
jgi:hypothetical protein